MKPVSITDLQSHFVNFNICSKIVALSFLTLKCEHSDILKVLRMKLLFQSAIQLCLVQIAYHVSSVLRGVSSSSLLVVWILFGSYQGLCQQTQITFITLNGFCLLSKKKNHPLILMNKIKMLNGWNTNQNQTANEKYTPFLLYLKF